MENTNLKKPITMLAQTEKGQFSEQGIHSCTDQVIGINPGLGLMVLAQVDSHEDKTAAHKAVEIMLDDMQLNLSSSTAKHCLSESVDNINEYLCLQAESTELMYSNKGVDLSAIQIGKNGISSCSLGKLSSLKFSANELQFLGDESATQNKLGVDVSLQASIVEQGFIEGDILFMSSSTLINQLGQDFIRITLSRFNDNLEMALRQINTRAQRHGLKLIPAVIVCRRNQHIGASRSWFNKPRK